MYQTSIDDSWEEPVDLAGLKAYLSLRDGRVDDSYLLHLAATAREMLEEGPLDGVISARRFQADVSEGMADAPIRLFGPLLSVDSVEYTDTDGDAAELDDWTAILGPRALLSVEWPDDIDGDLTVTYTAGYEHVPLPIVQAVKSVSRNLYERRDGDPLTPDIVRMVQPYRRLAV